MSIPEFGLLTHDQQEANACRLIYMQLAKLENEIKGAQLSAKVLTCDDKTWTDKYEQLLYIPHNDHTAALVVVLVDSLGDLTQKIDALNNIDIKFYLREYYYNIKRVVCTYDDAQAYYFSKSR